MTGALAGMVPRVPGPDPLGGTSYARPHPLAPVPLADPAANRMGSPGDWAHDRRPRRAVAVPPGYLLVQVTNGIPTSRGNHAPGDEQNFSKEALGN